MDMLPPITPHSFQHHVSALTVRACLEQKRASHFWPSSSSSQSRAWRGYWCSGDMRQDLVKSGYTATYWVVVVIAWETGQVLDYVWHGIEAVHSVFQKVAELEGGWLWTGIRQEDEGTPYIQWNQPHRIYPGHGVWRCSSHFPKITGGASP